MIGMKRAKTQQVVAVASKLDPVPSLLAVGAGPVLALDRAALRARVVPKAARLAAAPRDADVSVLREASRHLETLRGAHATRCARMMAAIQRHVPAGLLRFARPQGGLYLWCRLAAGTSARTVPASSSPAATSSPGLAFLLATIAGYDFVIDD